jgi:hypothetical protein
MGNRQFNSIRVATEEDIPVLLDMVQKFKNVSAYKDFPTDLDKLQQIVYNIITGDETQGIVLMTDKAMIVGIVSEPIFNTQRLASELMWWAEDKQGFRLFEAFEYWAKNVAHADLITMSSLESASRLDKFYDKRGYTKAEYTFIKELG